METVVLTPCAGPGSTQMVDDQDLHCVISKKQLQRYSRKRLVEEVFLVSFVNQDQGTLGPVLESVEEKKALLIEFQDVFCNDLPPGLPPVRVVEHD
ncbi:hypothetical protein G6F64_014457 [Rhizopus arrhizus]|uniref:Uncharacterized protein n=1 Tax=Rhizopus oryzae TaxID=64495 RepID=A0A9P6WTE1_RHIOR|nr:hypothetical protein G6F64_014457 [Rhizopus arrhizus]